MVGTVIAQPTAITADDSVALAACQIRPHNSDRCRQLLRLVLQRVRAVYFAHPAPSHDPDRSGAFCMPGPALLWRHGGC